ncbi:MAG: ion transporter [Erysipelotrichales bacterium]|nr:ion transporter [Erysipelotrichales bacterium]
MKSRKALWIFLVLILFAGLMGALYAAESNAEGATITSFPAALWYTLTTLTTVGYGDYTPVTLTGRIIGGFIQLCSLGVLAAMIGVILTAFRGTLWPLFRLSFAKKKKWFVFTANDEASVTLARTLTKEDPETVCLFTGKEEGETPGMKVSLTPEKLIRFKGDRGTLSVVDMTGAYRPDVQKESLYYYIQSAYEPAHLSDHVILFDPSEILARLYWHDYPVNLNGEKIVLIGSGKCAESLLEQALLVNITGKGNFVYHWFGDYEEFFRTHARLPQILSVGAQVLGKDALYVQKDAWNAEEKLLREADRIIFLDEDEAKTEEKLVCFLKYFVTEGTVYAKTSYPLDGVIRFGSPEEIYAPEWVLRTSLNRTAKSMHERYMAQSGKKTPAWNELDSFKRRSNLAAADHLQNKLRILLREENDPAPTKENFAEAFRTFENSRGEERDTYRAIEHERWLRFHLLYNWQYSPVRNDKEHLHPSLVPFEELTEEERAKDDYGWEILKNLAE